MLGDAFEDVSQVGLGVDAVELGGTDQAVDVGGTFAAGVGAGEEIILPTERDGAQRALGGVVVNLPTSICARPWQGG